VLVAVGSFLKGFNENPPPLNHITIITIPITTNSMAVIAMKIGKKGFFF
jgi:hypothetical protein